MLTDCYRLFLESIAGHFFYYTKFFLYYSVTITNSLASFYATTSTARTLSF